MTYIFIRHDKKLYANGKGTKEFPRFDPDLDYTIDSPHKELLQNIIPTRIFTSPFLRCRQTALRAYPNYNIEIIPHLADYLGNWKYISKKDFTDETNSYLKDSSGSDFIFEKSYNKFQDRINRVYAEQILPIPKEKEIFLIIFHGVCLKTWYKAVKKDSFNITLLGSLPEDGFKIDKFIDK
jgi:broad specificity phosphatase PhoE